MEYSCTKCKKNVTTRQFALQCDACDQWQHQKCDSGVSGAQYRKLRASRKKFSFWCNNCKGSKVIPPTRKRSASSVRSYSNKQKKKKKSEQPDQVGHSLDPLPSTSSSINEEAAQTVNVLLNLHK